MGVWAGPKLELVQVHLLSQSSSLPSGSCHSLLLKLKESGYLETCVTLVLYFGERQAIPASAGPGSLPHRLGVRQVLVQRQNE